MGKEILSNSAKDIEYEKKRMEYVLEKQKRLQVEQKSNFKIWLKEILEKVEISKK